LTHLTKILRPPSPRAGGMETWDCRERECGHGDGWGAGVIDDDDDRQISMLIRPTEIRCGGRELRGVRDETRAGRRDSEAMIGLCGEQENATRQVNWATVACASTRIRVHLRDRTARPLAEPEISDTGCVNL